MTPDTMKTPDWQSDDGSIRLFCGDCLDLLRGMKDCSVHSIVTDPPYGLSFMGKHWDYDVPSVDIWKESLRVLKPGGHLLSFAGTRTQHRMAVNIEDAGFEIRDMIAWVYGSGFPKSLDVSKAIDKAAGAEREVIASGQPVKRMIPGADQDKSGSWIKDNGREFVPTETAPATESAQQWDGWGTALKPSLEPITVARKPLIGTVAKNVLQHGTGAINVDGCRIGTESTPRKDPRNGNLTNAHLEMRPWMKQRIENGEPLKGDFNGDQGRFPANLIHDGSEEVLERFPETTSGRPGVMRKGTNDGAAYGAESRPPGTQMTGFGDTGSAARFFYCAKASGADRGVNNKHPTVKPTDLMRYLCRLVTPPGGIVLDPFCGSGSTGKAAELEGFRFIGMEREQEHLETSIERISEVVEDEKQNLFREQIDAERKQEAVQASLFEDEA